MWDNWESARGLKTNTQCWRLFRLTTLRQPQPLWFATKYYLDHVVGWDSFSDVALLQTVPVSQTRVALQGNGVGVGDTPIYRLYNLKNLTAHSRRPTDSVAERSWVRFSRPAVVRRLSFVRWGNSNFVWAFRIGPTGYKSENPYRARETSLYFTSLHFTSLHFTLLHFTLLYFTLLYFTSIHFTSLYFTLLYFTLLYPSFPIRTKNPCSGFLEWTLIQHRTPYWFWRKSWWGYRYLNSHLSVIFRPILLLLLIVEVEI